jgi:lipase
MEINFIHELKMQNIGEVNLPYLSYGDQGKPLILVHATGFISWLWHPIARDLSPTYRIIAPHIVDYRAADPEKGGFPWTTIAEDIVAFCEKTHIENPYLVGHSMGGTVLTLAVARHGLAAKAMILIEPIFLPQEFYRFKMKVEDHPLASKAMRRVNHWENAREAMAYLKSRTLFKKWDAEMLELYIDHGMKKGENGGLQLVCSPETEAALFMGGVQFDPWPLLPEVTCPVLVVEGGESDNGRFVDLKKVVSIFPHASHKVIMGAGHLIPMERPEEITAIIKDFFHHV